MLDSEKESLEVSCSLNLASCRLRAEALARHLHSKLWPLGRFELSEGSNCAYPCLKRYADKPNGSEPIIDKPPQSKCRQYGANSLNSTNHWHSDDTMFSSDDDEGYEPGNCSSPPSPADEEIVVNPPIIMPPVPASIETSPPLEEMTESPIDYGGVTACSVGATILSIHQPDKCKLVDNKLDLNYGRTLCERLQQYADSWTDSQDCVENSINHLDAIKDKGNRFEVTAVDSLSQVDSESTPPAENRFKVISCDSVTEKNKSETENTDSDPSSIETKTIESLISDLSIKSPSETQDKGEWTIVTPKRHEKGQLYLNVDVDEGRRQLIRSTSLKTGKTPPGTPRRKKIVRFADALGLDLEAVKHIVTDDIPIVPQSAYTDLQVTESEQVSAAERTWVATSIQSVTHSSSYSLYPQFQQPAMTTDFINRVRDQKLCLESVTVDDMTVHCVARVLNVCFEKAVFARYTTTEWATCEDVLASYVPGSNDGFSDKFAFNIYVPHLTPGQRLVFALRYVANGQEYWDNNRSGNYVLRCCSNSQILPLSQDAHGWFHHFM